jgi:small subunit ribosomal protein S1
LDEKRKSDRIAAANPEEDFAAMFAASERANPARSRRDQAKPGDRVRGKVVSIGREMVVLELEGGHGEGMLDPADLLDATGAMTVAVGETVDAVVVENAGTGRALALRRGLGRGGDARADLEQAFAHGIPVEGTITGANKGGVDVSIAGMRAFCPISQLDLRHVEDAAAFVGQKLQFRITRYEDDRRGPNIVVSRRALLEEEARARAVETRAKLVVGAVLPGVVTALKDYGAFVDLGGIEGMLHVSEIGYDRAARPGDVLSIGQRISVQVIRIEKKNDPKRSERVDGARLAERSPSREGPGALRGFPVERVDGARPAERSPSREGPGTLRGFPVEQIALSLKSLEEDPWDAAAQRFPEGTRARGTVTRVTPFGAFVELAPGIEGLLHVSELGGVGGGGAASGGGGGGAGAGRPPRDARDAIKAGTTLEVTVASVDRERRRLSLTLGNREEPLDPEARAAADRAAAPARMGTLGDLLRDKLGDRKG